MEKLFFFFFSIFLLKTFILGTLQALAGGPNEYPQCMFWTKNKNTSYTLLQYESGVRRVYITRTCLRDVLVA